jgi:hypothetical protein
MKTSRKILITIAAVLVILWGAILLVVRRDMDTLMANNAVMVYREVEVEPFDRIEFSSNWNVIIKQGKDCRVELEDEDGTPPEMINKKGSLFLKTERNLNVRVTAPGFREIKASGNTHISMKNFWADSLNLVLEDGSSFSGSKNDFDQVIFKVAGKIPANAEYPDKKENSALTN